MSFCFTVLYFEIELCDLCCRIFEVVNFTKCLFVPPITILVSQVYSIRAEELEKDKDFDKAALFHGKCLVASKAAEDRRAEGKANYRLGKATVMVEKAHEALAHLDNYVS